ncbi:MAG TPA: pyridoxamine 5'-phosphate oxidase [Solirubrobacterales bacterium]|jgi:pyridoxamine 5'-phosphate oxidase|nr:pyridoxamine 5'-phosphate oxidase [Solirubrobacterales bacterium]
MDTTGRGDPLEILGSWLDEARAAQPPAAGAMTLATVGEDGRPSARVVSLKQLEADALIFTTGLWSRKAEELRLNPRVAAVFYWPVQSRQVRVEGRGEVAERELAEQLFAGRPRGHQLQAIVSRQGETIEGLGPLRERLEQLREETAGQEIECPPDWGAIRIVPDRIEFWEEEPDRLHERHLYETDCSRWKISRLAP